MKWVAKKQSWLIFKAFWRPSEERWQLTELLTPQFSDWKRDKERSEEEKGQGSILYSVYSPTIHCPVSACWGKLSSISAA